MKSGIAALTALSLIVSGGCVTPLRPDGAVIDLSNPAVTRRSTERDRYEDKLRKSGFDEARLADWQSAGRRALRERLTIQPSFREVVQFSVHDPVAVGYRLNLRRGQQVSMEIRRLSGERSDLFADVFEEIAPPSELFHHVYSPHPDATSFRFESHSDGVYVLRLQPAIDGAGSFEVTVKTAAGLTFPVLHSNLKSVGSFFGDSRDGGKRDHEGIDIFAPRGTPVVAVAGGVITDVRTTPVGGQVVWHRDDERGVTYYYAHLDQQLVRPGQRVSAGDRIGTVGNTGNARTTPPHLHFSVYRPGQIALDPVPFLYNQPGNAVAAVTADVNALGSWARITGAGVRLRNAPTAEAAVITRLDPRARVRLIGGVRDWHRVALADGTTGFVAAALLEGER